MERSVGFTISEGLVATAGCWLFTCNKNEIIDELIHVLLYL